MCRSLYSYILGIRHYAPPNRFSALLNFQPGLHLLSFAENRRERIYAANIDEKQLTWFTLASIR